MYLGAVLQNITNDYGTEFWTMSSEKYLGATLKNVKEKFGKTWIEFAD